MFSSYYILSIFSQWLSISVLSNSFGSIFLGSFELIYVFFLLLYASCSPYGTFTIHYG